MAVSKRRQWRPASLYCTCMEGIKRSRRWFNLRKNLKLGFSNNFQLHFSLYHKLFLGDREQHRHPMQTTAMSFAENEATNIHYVAACLQTTSYQLDSCCVVAECHLFANLHARMVSQYACCRRGVVASPSFPHLRIASHSVALSPPFIYLHVLVVSSLPSSAVVVVIIVHRRSSLSSSFVRSSSSSSLSPSPSR